MPKRFRSRRSETGFTLIEILVILVIIGVLFAIAAPGWDAIIMRQRISTAREQVLQIIRQAQSEARTSKSARAAVFFPTPTGGGVPRVTTAPFSFGGSLPMNTASITNWKPLGDSVSANRSVKLTVTSQIGNNNALVFDSNGAIASPPLVTVQQLNDTNVNSMFAVTLSREGVADNNSKRCVIVQTLLGSVRTADGTDCP